MNIMNRTTLDSLMCQSEGCNCGGHILVLRARCHIHSGLEVRYDKTRGLLVVTCKKCENIVTEVLVAE